MTAKFRFIRLTVRHAGLLTSIPVLIAYIVLPVVYLSGVFWYTGEELSGNMVYAIETLLPISGIVWTISYLQTWIDSECEEALRACLNGSHICVTDLVILNIVYFVILAPVFLIFQLLSLNLWTEYPRVLVQILFLTGVLYLISVLLRSVAAGSMMTAAYHLFCIFFSGYGGSRPFCLIRPNISAERDTIPYLIIIVCAAAAYAAGAVSERTFYKKSI